MINATTIFSALGNNSSLSPIIFKDSIDNTGRVAMAYKEGSKNGHKFGMYDAREAFLEENLTSLVWIGGIPLLKNLYDRFVTNNIHKLGAIEEMGSTFDKSGKRVLADTNLNLLVDESPAYVAKITNKIKSLVKNNPDLQKAFDSVNVDSNTSLMSIKDGFSSMRPFAENNKKLAKFFKKLDALVPEQSLKNNIESIRQTAESSSTLKKIVEGADKILADQSKFKKTQAGKMVVSTIIPLAMVGFILPKFIQKVTKSIYRQDREDEHKAQLVAISESSHNFGSKSEGVFATFSGQIQKPASPAFKGAFSQALVNIFNNDVTNQAILDAGISGGRIATAIGPAQKIEKGIKEAGIVFFIYLGGRVVANGLEKLAGALGMPIKLDSKILEDTGFHDKVKSLAASPQKEQTALKKSLLAFDGSDEKSILNFINKQFEIKDGAKKGLELIKDSKTGASHFEFINPTLKAAQKVGLIDLVEDVINPFQKIDTKAIKSLNTSMSEFVEKALSKGTKEEVEKFLKKALNTKRGSIALNLALCSISTAYILPKIQYFFREKYTKSSKLSTLDVYEKQIVEEKKKAVA